jgi:hypothetical protein
MFGNPLIYRALVEDPSFEKASSKGQSDVVTPITPAGRDDHLRRRKGMTG